MPKIPQSLVGKKIYRVLLRGLSCNLTIIILPWLYHGDKKLIIFENGDHSFTGMIDQLQDLAVEWVRGHVTH